MKPQPSKSAKPRAGTKHRRVYDAVTAVRREVDSAESTQEIRDALEEVRTVLEEVAFEYADAGPLHEERASLAEEWLGEIEDVTGDDLGPDDSILDEIAAEILAGMVEDWTDLDRASALVESYGTQGFDQLFAESGLDRAGFDARLAEKSEEAQADFLSDYRDRASAALDATGF